MSSFSLFVSAGLNTYLISGRKFEPHPCCGFSQLGSAGHELAEQCAASRAHTPDGASSVCSLPPDGVKVSVHSSSSEKESGLRHDVVGENIFLASCFIACLNCLRRNTELPFLRFDFHQFCTLHAVVYVGVLKAFSMSGGRK